MKPGVLVFRSELLPPSETFIAAQAAALRRYQPVFAGLRRCEPSLPLSAPAVLPGMASRLLRPAGFVPGFHRAIRSHAPVLLHAHFALDAAAALPLQRALRLPMVVTLHGYDVMCSDAAHRATRGGRLYLARRSRLWQQTHTFLCVSQAIAAQAAAGGFPRHKLCVLPIGVDTELLQPVAPRNRQEDEPTILFAGRLVPKKGCLLLLEAMARMQRSLPGSRLVIAGDGPQRRMLEAAAARLTVGTRFLGRQTPEQLRALMQAARCLAAPSMTAENGDAEGLPLVLCEALALGLPVASTFHSGIPELIRHDRHGLLSEEGDAKTLARHLLHLCSDDLLAERLARAGRLRVEQQFSLRRQTEALEAIYDDVARAGTGAFAGKGAGEQAVVSRREGSEDLDEGLQVDDDSIKLSVSAGMSEVPRSRSGWNTSKHSACEDEMPAPTARRANTRLRTQAAWLLSGNGAAILLQAVYFLLIGRLLGSREYGGFVGVVALVNVLAQFSSVGMEMVLLRTVARDRSAFAVTWGRALLLTGAGFVVLLAAVLVYGRLFLPAALLGLLPYLAASDALFGKLTQLSSRALQGADLARWSAKLAALTNAARAATAGLLFVWAAHTHAHVSLLLWARLYCGASLLVAITGVALVTRLLGRPLWSRVRRGHLLEGLSFSFSSSAISVYNDVDKTLLVSCGMQQAAGIYGAAYRVVDVVSTPIVSLFAAASPRLFRSGAQAGPAAARRGARGLLRWAGGFGLLAVPLLLMAAPLLPKLFGHSFAGSTEALRWLCLLPLLRALHYAWGTAITACASQWWRTAAQAGTAIVNLALNLWLIPRWGWHGAAIASLLTDGLLAVSTFVILRLLVARSAGAAARQGAAGVQSIFITGAF